MKRTFPEEKEIFNDVFLDKLKNVLICYSLRNTSVGYCQGMNFIGGRLLLIMGNEEHAFWLFVQLMENILPIIYYSELVGIVVETTLIEALIEFYFPKFNEFLIENNFNVSLRNFINKWMVCLFTQSMSPEMVYTFFDFLFLEGRELLIKNALFIISFIHDKFIMNNDIECMYSIFNKGILNIHDPRTMMYFLDEKKYELKSSKIQNFYKKLEDSIVSKFKEEAFASKEEKEKKSQANRNSLKNKGVICNPIWPTCYYDDYTQNIVDVLILRESKLPNIIDDYYYIKHKKYPDNDIYGIYGYDQATPSPSIMKEVFIERHKHICDNAKLVDNSKLFIDNEFKRLDITLVNWEKRKNDEKLIYDKLKGSKKFDNVMKEIKFEMKKIIKPIKIDEINLIIQNNENSEKYYPDDYAFHDFV